MSITHRHGVRWERKSHYSRTKMQMGSAVRQMGKKSGEEYSDLIEAGVV